MGGVGEGREWKHDSQGFGLNTWVMGVLLP